MSQSNGVFAEAVSWTSISGLTWLMAFSAALTIEAIARRKFWVLAAPAVLALAAALVPVFPTSVIGTARVAAVQPNSLAGFFDERGRYDQSAALLAASSTIPPGSVDLVAWPEGFDGDPFRDPYLTQVLAGEVNRVGAPVLANAAVTVGDDTFNTSLLWTADTPVLPQATGVATHAKRNPVPFGEYVPNRGFYEKIVPHLIGLVQREYTPGADAPLIVVPTAEGSIRVALAICFDVIYDQVIREGIDGGGEFFVFQTNNADFRGTPESEQQLTFARMRAFETGRAVVNISTIGTSAIIGADGTITEQLPADVVGVLTAQIERRVGTTPGVAIGRSVEIAATVLGVTVLLACTLMRRRDMATKPQPTKASATPAEPAQ